MTARLQLSLPIPCAVARQDAASPEAGRHLGGAAFSRALEKGARLEVAPPRRNNGVSMGGEGREEIYCFLPWAPVGQSRHHLPHWEQEGTTCFATFRLADSLPQEKLAAWRDERDRWLAIHLAPRSEAEEAEYRDRFEGTLQRWLDAGYGSCLLRASSVRKIVEGALRFFDGERYRLHAYVVMPNHVHVLFTPAEGRTVGRILQSWTGFAARTLNAELGREGTLWEKESWDRFIRTRFHFERTVAYIRGNPGKLPIPVYVAGEKARLEVAPPRAGNGMAGEGDLGGAAFSRALEKGARLESRTPQGGDGARLEVAPPREGGQ